MKRAKPFIWAMSLLFSACQPQQPEVAVYRVQPKDFVEKIMADGTLEAVQQNTVRSPSNMTTKVARLLEEGTQVKAGDTLCILESEQLASYVDRFTDDVEKTRVELVKQETSGLAQISLLETQLKEQEIQHSISAMDSVQRHYAPDGQRRIMDLEQQKREIEMEKLRKKLDAQRRINEQTIRGLTSQLMQQEQQLQFFNDQLKQLIILAPMDGLLVYAESPYMAAIYASGGSIAFGGNLKMGSTVRRQQALFHLPDLDHMQVNLMVSETDFKRISKGQKVYITPESVRDQIFSGSVSSISLVGEVIKPQSKVKYYKIMVGIDSTDYRLRPGLSARCDIMINEIRDTLVVPTVCIHQTDTLKFVYQRSESWFDTVFIQSGIGNATETVITKGLIGSEELALIDPPISKIRKNETK